jgi:ribonuclease BN (tRNA processing enzyme)
MPDHETTGPQSAGAAEGRGRGMTRRAVLGGSTLAAAAGTLGSLTPTKAQASLRVTPAVVGAAGRTQVYLLGAQGGQNRSLQTGSNHHAGTSVLLMVNGAGYLIDAGVGTLLRLNERGFDPTVIRNVFVTHQHTDHNADLGNMIGFGWTTASVTSTTEHMSLWGPPGTQDFVAGWEQSTALSNNDQVRNLDRRVPLSKFLTCHEFPLHGDIRTKPVQIMRDSNVAVSAIRVSHGAMPAVGYRVKTPDLDVVFSGDRGPGNNPEDPGDVPDNFVALARGARILFHEIIDIQRVLAGLPSGTPKGYIDHMKYDHSPPEFAGKTATAARVPELMLYHLVPADPRITPGSRWIRLVSRYYTGKIVVGHDLQKVG